MLWYVLTADLSTSSSPTGHSPRPSWTRCLVGGQTCSGPYSRPFQTTSRPLADTHPDFYLTSTQPSRPLSDVFPIHTTSRTSRTFARPRPRPRYTVYFRPLPDRLASRVLHGFCLTCQKNQCRNLNTTDQGRPLLTAPDGAGHQCRPREIISRPHDRV